MRHFFIETEPGSLLAPGDTVTLDKEESHHLGTVLRGGRQPDVVLTDGRGNRFQARVVDRNRRQSTLEIQSVHRDEDEFSPPLLVLALAVIKVKRLNGLLRRLWSWACIASCPC